MALFTWFIKEPNIWQKQEVLRVGFILIFTTIRSQFFMLLIKDKARKLGLTIFPVHGGYKVSNLDGVFSFEQLKGVFCEQ
jgi:hypothetical protein